MPAASARAAECVNLGKVLSFLREWDRADKTTRCRVLTTFVSDKPGRTFQELELEFAQVASLFLARITTWMRLTYKFSTSLGLQLKAIQVFLFANQDQYLTEFLEDGGVLTLLDILNQGQTKGEDRVEVLKVLLIVADTGRRYKEFICEGNGVNVLAECLSTPYSEEIQDKTCAVLHSLSQGNPKYINHVYQKLTELLLNTSPRGQKRLLGTLRFLQSKMKTAPHSLVDPLLEMLKTLHLEVQEEAINFILELKSFNVRPLLLNGLVSLLKLTPVELENAQTTQISEMIRKTGSLPEFVQQAAAAKVIRLLAEHSEEMCRDLVALGVVQSLIGALGNKEHCESQIQASLALEVFIRSSLVIQQDVKRIMGDTLFSIFLINPATVHKTLSETQAEYLLSNSVLTQMQESS
ncbi:hypothetical protein WMY93_025253 [Mugilogobius chulae]|uniref:Armadillo like helical domain containing 1 n=1 Tax=Mugilogobius chulae TaxID=88201 RepID=A0AAW0N545_9GOBI